MHNDTRRSLVRTAMLSLTLASTVLSSPAFAQDYSSLETPVEMPKSWVGSYAKSLTACHDDADLEGLAIERKGLHFYEAAALALRIVWVDDNNELYMYGILGGEGSAGPASYRIRRADDGQSIVFFGGKAADDEKMPGEHLIKCPESVR